MSEIEIRLGCLQMAIEFFNANAVPDREIEVLKVAKLFYDFVITPIKPNKLVMEKSERH